MSESAIQAEILRRHGARPDARLFRNTVGEGWQGTVIAKDRGTVTLSPGCVLLRNARYVTFGLAPGSSDLIGWRTLEILPAHVGRRLGQFLAIEVKSPTGRARGNQADFIAVVSRLGGCAGIARSADDVDHLLKRETP